MLVGAEDTESECDAWCDEDSPVLVAGAASESSGFVLPSVVGLLLVLLARSSGKARAGGLLSSDCAKTYLGIKRRLGWPAERG